MSANVGIKDSKTGQSVRVTRFGQLVVSPLAFSTSVRQELDTINTAFNFLLPVDGESIVITDIIVSADNNVSNVTPAEIEIYEATAPDSTTIDTGIVGLRLVRADNIALNALNLLIPEGQFVNAKTNDNNVLVTIMFYRVPVEIV